MIPRIAHVVQLHAGRRGRGVAVAAGRGHQGQQGGQQTALLPPPTPTTSHLIRSVVFLLLGILGLPLLVAVIQVEAAARGRMEVGIQLVVVMVGWSHRVAQVLERAVGRVLQQQGFRLGR